MKIIKGGRDRMNNFEVLTTDELLAMHEKHFAPLDAKSKARMITGARTRGWDRTWDSTPPLVIDGLAA